MSDLTQLLVFSDQCCLHQESSCGWRKVESRSLVRVSVLYFLQWFDTDSCVTGSTSDLSKPWLRYVQAIRPNNNNYNNKKIRRIRMHQWGLTYIHTWQPTSTCHSGDWPISTHANLRPHATVGTDLYPHMPTYVHMPHHIQWTVHLWCHICSGPTHSKLYFPVAGWFVQFWAFRGAKYPKWEIPCPGRQWTTVQNLPPLALSSAEISVTIQTNKQ